MNYSTALSFTFEDNHWLKKLAIGGCVSFVSFYLGLSFLLPDFLLWDTYIGLLRNVIQNENVILPADWADLSKIFLDGLMGGYYFPALFNCHWRLGYSCHYSNSNSPPEQMIWKWG